MRANGHPVWEWSNDPGHTYPTHAHPYTKILCCLDESVPVLVLFWGDPAPYVERARAAGTKLVAQVGSVDQAGDRRAWDHVTNRVQPLLDWEDPVPRSST